MGGFIQVGAHGTGREIAPVDEYITKLKVVTPGKGTVVLNREEHGRLFELARVGLGCLGVVVEVTMKCVPAHRLVEHTFVLTRAEAMARKDQLLKNHKHMRFMWIPYTDAVVVVTNDPEHDVAEDVPRDQLAPGTDEERNKPLTDLLRDLCQKHGVTFSLEEVKGMGFGELRGTFLIVSFRSTADGTQSSSEIDSALFAHSQFFRLSCRRPSCLRSAEYGSRQTVQSSRSRFLEKERGIQDQTQ